MRDRIASMRFRKLRIAFCVTCAIAGLLLIALWLRSYWWIDSAIGPLSTNQRFGATSASGWLTFRWNQDPRYFSRWSVQHTTVEWLEDFKTTAEARGERVAISIPSFGFSDGAFQIPHWLFLSPFLLATVAAAPWMRWRFSLRTLLIGTTIIAIVLALAVYATRK